MFNNIIGTESGFSLPEMESTFPDWWYRVSDICRDYPAIIQGERTVTYKELDEKSNQFANSLLSRGYKKGNKIAVWFPSIPEYLEAFIGAMKIDAIYMGSSIAPMYPDDWIVELINKYDTDILLTHESVLDRLEKLRPKLNVKEYIMAGREENIPDYAVHYESIRDESPKIRPEFDWKIKPEDITWTAFSGGTTGIPKIIDHRQASIPGTYPRVVHRIISEKMLPKLLKSPEENLKKVATLLNSPYNQIFLSLTELRSIYPEYVIGAIRSIFDTPELISVEILPYLFGGKMKAIVHTPLWTSWGFAFFILTFYYGGCMILGQKDMDMHESLSLVEKHKAQILFSLPFDPGNKQFIDVMNESKYDLGSLTIVGGIGAPSMIKEVVRLTPQSFYLGFITSSEPTICGINMFYNGDEEVDEGIYYLSPYTFIFNLDEGRPARVGELGNTVTAGRYCFKGYEKIERKVRDWVEYDGRDWFIDGTKGYLDEKGRIKLSGIEYALKTIHGKLIDLKKVELTILVNPKVSLVGCLPDKKEENLIAVVERKPGVTITQNEIESFCRERLEEQEVPTEILIVEPGGIPRTRYGAVSYDLLTKFLKKRDYDVA